MAKKDDATPVEPTGDAAQADVQPKMVQITVNNKQIEVPEELVRT